MKRLAILLFLIVGIFSLRGQNKQPNSVPDKQVPKAVLKKFKEKRPSAVDVKWYSYPNQYGTDKGAAPSYYPIGWAGNTQDYYEVRFSDEKGKVREVYDRGGFWKVTSRPIEHSALPEELISQLTEKGYAAWQKVNLEKISRTGQKGQFYKIWITQDKRKRILFFDESFKLVKTLRWDNDIKLMVNADAKLKDAPGVRRNRRIIAAEKVPSEIRTKARKNHVDVEFIEWSVSSRTFDPFDETSGFSYYDVVIPAYYQLIFSHKSSRLIASYSSEGELLEIADLMETKRLPKAIRKTISSEAYEGWKWENEHERVESEDGQVYYRVYGAESDTPNVLVLNEDGTKAKDK